MIIEALTVLVLIGIAVANVALLVRAFREVGAIRKLLRS